MRWNLPVMLKCSTMRPALLITGLLAGTCLLSTAATALAAVEIGAGSRAAVAVDPSGMAYIAFNGAESPDPALRLCRLPRGATACASLVTLPVAGPGTLFSDTRPFVSVSGGTVRVLSYRFGFTGGGDSARVVLYTSTDSGASFGAGQQVGTLAFDGDATAGPGEGVSLVNTASATHSYQRVATDGGSPSATTRAALSGQYLYGGSVGLAAPDKPVVVFRDDTNAAFTAFVSGPINDGSSWSAPQVIGPSGYERVAGGPAGLFAMLATGGHLEVRKFSGGTFGSPTMIPSSNGSRATSSDLAQDAAGRLQATWSDASGNLFQSSSDDGVTWVTQQLTTFADVRDMRSAGAADHGGVTTWTAGTGSTAKVYATALLPPPTPPPPAGTPPVAAFTISPGLPCTNQTVTFNASASRSFVGSGRLTYLWSIGAVGELQGWRNPEDAFRGETGPVHTQTFGPLRERTGPVEPFNLYQLSGDVVRSGIVYGRHYRVPLVALLYVTDEAGVTTQIDHPLKFGDAGYNPFPPGYRDDPPLGPTPKCPGYRVPLPISIGRGGLVSSGATTSITAGCPPGAPCIGRVTLTAASGARSKARTAANAAKPPLKLATARVALPAGKHSKIALKLTRPGQRLLRKHPRLRVTIRIVATNQSGKSKTTTRTTTLRLRQR